ncbi:hypothetical protein AKJ16_DCAP14322 [Drosera capensis]
MGRGILHVLFLQNLRLARIVRHVSVSFNLFNPECKRQIYLLPKLKLMLADHPNVTTRDVKLRKKSSNGWNGGVALVDC